VRRAAFAAVALAAALPASAEAHSVVRVGGGTLNYIAVDATSLNSLDARVRGKRIDLRDRTVDGGIAPGPCDPGDISDDAQALIVQVLCARRRVSNVSIDLGEREDRARIQLALPVTLLGGPGSDDLRTGPGEDRVQADTGNDRVAAGAGEDFVDGGLGFDVLDAGDGDDQLQSADGLADRVTCGPGSDRVDADTVDDLAGDCEQVTRRPLAPPAGAEAAAGDRTRPRVESDARALQKLGRRSVRLLATTSERGFLAASGFLDVGGISLPLQSDRKEVPVAGGGASLTVKLTSRDMRRAGRALRRGRRASIRMWVVGTDVAGNSRQARAVRIRLRR
jgi:hypothetical protein